MNTQFMLMILFKCIYVLSTCEPFMSAGLTQRTQKSDGCPIYENDSYRLCVSADLSSAARNICTCIMHVFLQPAPPLECVKNIYFI